MPQESKILKIVFLQTGKTKSKEIVAVEKEYSKRINRYLKFETIVVPDLKNTKNLPEEGVKKKGRRTYSKKISTRRLYRAA